MFPEGHIFRAFLFQYTLVKNKMINFYFLEDSISFVFNNAGKILCIIQMFYPANSQMRMKGPVVRLIAKFFQALFYSRFKFT